MHEREEIDMWHSCPSVLETIVEEVNSTTEDVRFDEYAEKLDVAVRVAGPGGMGLERPRVRVWRSSSVAMVAFCPDTSADVTVRPMLCILMVEVCD